MLSLAKVKLGANLLIWLDKVSGICCLCFHSEGVCWKLRTEKGGTEGWSWRMVASSVVWRRKALSEDVVTCSSKKKNKKTPNPRLITKCRMRCADDVLLSEGRGCFASCWGLWTLYFCQSWLAGAKAVAAWGEGCRDFCRVSYGLISKRRNRKNWNLVTASDGLQRKLHLFGPGKWLLTVGGRCRGMGRGGLIWDETRALGRCRGFPAPCNTGLPQAGQWHETAAPSRAFLGVLHGPWSSPAGAR